MDDPQAVPLTYANDAGGGASPYRLAKIALVAVCVPVGLGLAATAAFVATGADVFIMVGLLALMVGPFVVLGTLVLAVLALSQNGRRAQPDPLVKRRAIAAIVIGLMHFPAAFGCMMVGGWAGSRIDLTVTNRGDTLAQDVQLVLAGTAVEVGDLPPGATWKGVFRPGSGRESVKWSVQGTEHHKIFTEHSDQDSFWRGASYTIDNDEAMRTWH